MSENRRDCSLDEESCPSNLMASDTSEDELAIDSIITEYQQLNTLQKEKADDGEQSSNSGEPEVIFKKCTSRGTSSNSESSAHPSSGQSSKCDNDNEQPQASTSTGENCIPASADPSLDCATNAVQGHRFSKLRRQSVNADIPEGANETEPDNDASTIAEPSSSDATTDDPSKTNNYASSPSLATLDYGESGEQPKDKARADLAKRCQSSLETQRSTDGSARTHMTRNGEVAPLAMNKIRSKLSPEEVETLKRHKDCSCGKSHEGSRDSGCSSMLSAAKSRLGCSSSRNKSASPRAGRSPKVAMNSEIERTQLERQRELTEELTSVFNEVNRENGTSSCGRSFCLPIPDKLLKFRHQINPESEMNDNVRGNPTAENDNVPPTTNTPNETINSTNAEKPDADESANNEESNDAVRSTNSNGLLRGLRRFTNWLPNFAKGTGKRNTHPESLGFVNAISVPNLSAIPEHIATNRSRSDPVMQSKSIAFGLNRLHEKDELADGQTPCPTLASYNDAASTIDPDSVSCSTASKSSFQKHNKSSKSRPTRFEPKATNYQVAATSASTLPPNLSAPQYASCLCLSPPSAFGVMSSSDGSASLYSGSSIATLPMHASQGHASVMMDGNLRYRYLTYGTSAQLQQEYGKVLPWPTLTEFRLRRKFRRLKRRARKLIGGNLFSGKSFLIKRFVKRRNSHPERSLADAQQALCNANFAPVSAASRSSSLTSLLDLIEEANKNIINSFNRSPGPTPKMAPPKCPPRLKRTQSSINVSNLQSQLRTGGTLPSGKHLVPLEEESLWKPNMSDYQIAFIEQSQQSQASPSIQSSPKAAPAEPDTISVKSLDSYFGPASLPSASAPSAATSPRTAKTLARNVQVPAKSKSRTLMVRSHFEINNGTIYLEDSDWEMCSEVSELNSLNHIETQAMDSVSMVPNDSSLDVDPSREAKEDETSKSSLESSKVSLGSNSSTSGFSEPKSEAPVSQPIECVSEFITEQHSTKQEQEVLLVAKEEVSLRESVTKPTEGSPASPVKRSGVNPPESVCSHQQPQPCADNSPVYAVPIKKKPALPVKPKAESKPEPIYAKPNKSKYPPKHCCIARPAQPPPEAPKARTLAVRNAAAAARAAQKVQFRKKVKAPAPPPPKATVARPVARSEVSQQTANLKCHSNATSSATNPSATSAPNYNKPTKSSSSRIKLNNLIKKNNSNGNGTAPASKAKSTKVFTSKAKPKEASTPTGGVRTTTTAVSRSASKSPFKALISRLNPRNQDEGHAQSGDGKTKLTTIEQETTQIAPNDAERAQSPLKEEPIYCNVNKKDDKEVKPAPVDGSESTAGEISATQVTVSGELNSSTISVVDLIDKFNKLNDIPPESPIVVPKMATNKTVKPTSDQPSPSTGVRFESILSNKPQPPKEADPLPAAAANLEGEFQHYLQEFRSNSPDNLDQKQLIEQLCSELIHKFEQTKNPKEAFASPFAADSRTAPKGFSIDPNSTSRSADFANPNWLFLFFLHNQRQMFKEILHEMLSTIQKSQSQSGGKEEKTGGSAEASASSRSEEMNEFKQLIQMLQSTIAGKTSTPDKAESPTPAAPPVVPVGTVTANVVTPVVVSDVKPLKSSNKKGKNKEKKPKEKKHSAKKSREAPEPPPTTEETVKDSDMESPESAASATANVKSSNRFVNKIVLNNSINQFNFTMNQEGPTSTKQTPQASIVNVFNDQSTNQAASVFDINVAKSQAQTENHSSEEEDSEVENDETTVAVAVQPSAPKCASPLTQHRTVLQIKNPSGGSSSSGFLSTLRYRLEKKRNKKLMERFKKEQLAASQLSILDAIKEAEECTPEAEPKVTLANTSKLEIKVTPDSTESQMSKMGTLRRLLSPSRGGASKREKVSSAPLKLDDGNESDASRPVGTLDHLVARHRNSQYIPQISEPRPTGLEYSLFGTMRRSHGKDGQRRLRAQIPMEMIATSGGQRSAATRSLSERNFRSISVIKLNEMPSYEPVEIGDHHRQYIRNYRGNPMPLDRHIGGSHLNLSSSSLSSSVALPITGRRGSRGYPASASSQYSRHQSNYNSSDDFDDEQSTTSSRSKMVTFTLPRSFKPKSRTLHGGSSLGGHREGAREEFYADYSGHRYQSPRRRYIEETDYSETDQTEGDAAEETETEAELDEQYYLARSRLNERYFRPNQR